MARETRSRTPQEYEILSGGGAEAAELTRKGLSRRQVLRRAVAIGAGVVGLESVALALTMLYPNGNSGFGGKVTLKAKTEYPTSNIDQMDIDAGKGVFYESSAKAYIVHLPQNTPWLLSGALLEDQLTSQSIAKDKDGTYWIAIYQRCVHLGCKFNFNNSCRSFKCPCHGSHYNVSGEWLSGPAPKSTDRFAVDVSGGSIVVDTSKLNTKIQHPTPATQLLEELAIQHTCD